MKERIVKRLMWKLIKGDTGEKLMVEGGLQSIYGEWRKRRVKGGMKSEAAAVTVPVACLPKQRNYAVGPSY